MSNYIYKGHLGLNTLDKCEDALSREDLRTIKKKWESVSSDLAAKRMYEGISSAAITKEAFILGYLAALCIDEKDTPVGKAFDEEAK